MIITLTIPEGDNCLLQPGDRIDFGEAFMENGVKKQVAVLVAEPLGIQPKKIFRYLKKFVGDRIKKNEAIAVKNNLLSRKKIIAPADGIIQEIDHKQGNVILTIEEKEKKTKPAFFKGEIEAIKKGIIRLSVGEGEEIPIKKTGKSFGGEICYLSAGDIQQINANLIAKKIIFCQTLNPFVQAKIEALGSLGLVTLIKPDNTNLPCAQIKNSDDCKKIEEKKFPYCLIDHLSSKIYFYR